MAPTLRSVGRNPGGDVNALNAQFPRPAPTGVDPIQRMPWAASIKRFLGRVLNAPSPLQSSTDPRVAVPSSSLLGALLAWSRDAMTGLAVMSGVVNILALTGSFYMLQVYDRVLASHSISTLVGITGLMLGLYALYGILDTLRCHVLGRLGLRIDRLLRDRVFGFVLRAPLENTVASDGLQAVRDLDQVRAVVSGPGPVAVFDAPWLPVYLFLVYLLHPALGLLATAGAAVLLGVTILTERRARAPALAVAASAGSRQLLLDIARRNAEIVRAIGLGPALKRRWAAVSERHMHDTIYGLEGSSGLVTFSRVFRMALQSGMLGLGAYIVIRGEATGGVMIAASIMGGRALAPIETAIANWRGIVAARQSYDRLIKALGSLAVDRPRLALPVPCERLDVQSLYVGPPGAARPTVHNASFSLQAGDGVGIIGPSASGKSTLARALVGVWSPLRGDVCLDGSALPQWNPDVLGPHVGYVPQDVEIFDGTIAENIARLEENPDPAAVIAAARAADVHDMIVAMPDGYDTRVGHAGSALSAGQRQRIALARALYGNPFLVVLDEPNSNLDAQGDAALSRAIGQARARGAIVVVVAHRPSAIGALNKLLMMEDGQVQAFGAKEDVLARVTQRTAGPAAARALALVGQASRKG